MRNQSGLTSLSVVVDVLYCLRTPQTPQIPTPENTTCDTDKNVNWFQLFFRWELTWVHHDTVLLKNTTATLGDSTESVCTLSSKREEQMNQTALHYVRGFQPAWKSQHKMSDLKNVAASSRRGASPPSWRPAQKNPQKQPQLRQHTAQTSQDGVQRDFFTRHMGTKVGQGDGDPLPVIFSWGSTPLLQPRRSEQTDRRVHIQASPLEDHVTRVRPQSLSIDCPGTSRGLPLRFYS